MSLSCKKHSFLEFSERPIFLNRKRINASFLNDIYQSFLFYNGEEKLEHQFNKTQHYCHARAHFVTELLLKPLGIDTLKVTKLWNYKEWKNFPIDWNWDFHTATMIIDNQNQAWVWDPWTMPHSRLLTLAQWLIRSDEPPPYKFIISNNDTIHYQNSVTSDSTHPQIFLKSEYLAMMETMFYAALPIPIDTALIKIANQEKRRVVGHQHGLFKPKSIAIKPHHSLVKMDLRVKR